MCTAMYAVALGEPVYGEVYAVLALKFFFFTVGFWKFEECCLMLNTTKLICGWYVPGKMTKIYGGYVPGKMEFKPDWILGLKTAQSRPSVTMGPSKIRLGRERGNVWVDEKCSFFASACPFSSLRCSPETLRVRLTSHANTANYDVFVAEIE